MRTIHAPWFASTCAAIFLVASCGGDIADAAEADGFVPLFNGKNLDGWKVSEDNPETFKVVDGEIVAHGEAAHLFYDGPVENHNFKDFEYECEVLTKPKANSGMYFHTKYQPKSWPTNGVEVQVNQTHGDPKKTGSL